MSDNTKTINAIRRLCLKDLDATSDAELQAELISDKLIAAYEDGRRDGLRQAAQLCHEIQLNIEEQGIASPYGDRFASEVRALADGPGWEHK